MERWKNSWIQQDRWIEDCKDNQIDGQKIVKITRQLEIKMERWKDKERQMDRRCKDSQRERWKDGRMD